MTVGQSELSVAGEIGASITIGKESCPVRSLEIRNQRPLSYFHLLKRRHLSCHVPFCGQDRLKLIVTEMLIIFKYSSYELRTSINRSPHIFTTSSGRSVTDCLDQTKMYSCDGVF